MKKTMSKRTVRLTVTKETLISNLGGGQIPTTCGADCATGSNPLCLEQE